MTNKKRKTAEEMIEEAQPKMEALSRFLKKNPIGIPKNFCKNCESEEPFDINFMSPECSQFECVTCGLQTYSDKEGTKYILEGKEKIFD